MNQLAKSDVLTKPAVILLVEDDREMRSLLSDELRDMGYQTVEAGDGHAALGSLAESLPDLIVTDLRMPGGGLGYVRRLRVLAPTCPVILMTAFGDSETRADALKWGVAAYYDKPVRIGELKTAIGRLLGRA